MARAYVHGDEEDEEPHADEGGEVVGEVGGVHCVGEGYGEDVEAEEDLVNSVSFGRRMRERGEEGT